MSTIKEVAQATGLSEDTIRYYEKIRLLPRVERKSNGHRSYGPDEIDKLQLIVCLKKTGLQLEDIKPFLNASLKADREEDPQLVNLMLEHRQHIQKQIEALQQVVAFIDTKLEEGLLEKQPCEEDMHKQKRSDNKKEAFNGISLL